MKVRTSVLIRATRDHIWPLLTSSRMELPGCFCFGLPQPVACELPRAKGGVGAERRCISDRGTVIQKITTWQPPEWLQFEMQSTDHGWARFVDSLEEDFRIEQTPIGTRVTRTTTIRAKGAFRSLKELCFCVGLKRVHHYVFGNWRTIAERDAALALTALGASQTG